jgi:hypothetical protein
MMAMMHPALQQVEEEHCCAGLFAIVAMALSLLLCCLFAITAMVLSPLLRRHLCCHCAGVVALNAPA